MPAGQKNKKRLDFRGNSKEVISRFPEKVKIDVGFQLYKVQVGEEPDSWEPMKRVGPGTNEIRVRDEDGWFRVLYVAKFEEAIYVLHAFQKKTNDTPQGEIDAGKRRYKELEEARLRSATQTKRR